MKKKICSIIFLTIFLSPLLGSFYEEISVSKEEISSPTTISRIITLEFPRPIIVKKPELGEYVWLKLPDCRYITTPGHPALPIKVVTIKMDRYDVISGIELNVTERELEGNYTVTPAFRPTPLNSRKEKGVTEPEPSVYLSRNLYPNDWYSYRVYHGLDPETMNRVTYLVVYFYPLRYIPAEGRVIRAEKANLTITYSRVKTASEYQPTMDLVIITSQQLVERAINLAQWKNVTGIRSIVVTTEWIYSNYQGVDGPEKIRNYIKDAVNTTGIKFVLIFGDADQVPVRYAWIPDGFDDDGDSDGSVVETDLYYADLDYSWDDNGDGRWGDIKNDTIDGVPDVFVGRLPASNVSEAEVLVGKIQSYNPLNEWFMRYLLLGTNTFGNYEGEILKDYINSNIMWANFSYTKLYESSGSLTVTNAIMEINKGYGFINFAGHGNYDLWFFGSEGSYDSIDAYNQVNGNTSVIFAMACLTARFSDRDCIGEAFLLNPNGGGIAYYGSSRVAWCFAPGEAIIYGLAGEMDWRFTEAFFDCLNQSTPQEPYSGVVWGTALARYAMNHPPSDWNLDWKTVAGYGTLLGDPTICLRGTGAPPPPPPPSKLHGYVYNLEGLAVENASVKAYNYYTGALLGQNKTDGSGYYEIYNLGYYGYIYIEVNASGYYTFRSAGFRWSPGIDVIKNATLTAPFPVTVDILIVVDDDAEYSVDKGVWPDEIRLPIEYAGYGAHVWNETVQGLPCLEALFDVDAVIWHTGTMWSDAVDPVDSRTLIQYVQLGGNLLLEGEDIGFDHRSDEFMKYVAHATFLVDDAGVSSLEVTWPEHPVVTNLPSNFSFLTKPPYPDGVKPTNGGQEVIRYKDTNFTAVTVYNGRIKSEGRVVYIAFPLHYLSQEERQTLLVNSIKWLGSPYTVNASTDKRWYYLEEDIMITANVTSDGSAVIGAEVTAHVYDPYGNAVTSLILLDDGTGGDATPNDGVYTGIFAGLESSHPLGLYKIKVHANITDYGVEVGEATFLFIGENNLIVEVYNTYNEPAPHVSINIIDQNTSEIVRWWEQSDENGIYFTNLTEGTYAVMAWSYRPYHYNSGRTDNFFLLERDISVSYGHAEVVKLNASAGVSLVIQCYNIDSQPQDGFWIDLYPSIGGFGLDVARTDESGQATIYVTPGDYHIAARLWQPEVPNYYLYKLNVEVAGSSTVTFQPTPETTSVLVLKLNRVAKDQYGVAYINPQSLPLSFGFYYWGDVIVTPDEWSVWCGYTFFLLENGYWSYFLWCEPTLVYDLTTPGSTATFNYGGRLNSMLHINGPYNPGDKVPIFWNLTDSYGNVVDGIYEGTEHFSEPAFVAKIHGEKRFLYSSGTVRPLAYRTHYPYLTIIDPDGSPIMETEVYWWEKPKQYALSTEAVNGIYKVRMEINTGPYQGTLTIENQFIVGPPYNYTSAYYAFVTGLSGGIFYSKFNGAVWSPWFSLGGYTEHPPSAVYYNGSIWIATRGGGGGIWYGLLDTTTDSFSGWLPIPGSTPSKPALAAALDGVILAVRGEGNEIWINKFCENGWSGWVSIPGATVDSPALATIGNTLHIVVRGADGYSLWHGLLDISTWPPRFIEWLNIYGVASSTPDLAVDNSSSTLYLIVKGLDNNIYFNTYTHSMGWHGWINIPSGATDQGPAVSIGENLYVMVKGLDGGIWLNIKEQGGSWRGWMNLPGATNLQPELVYLILRK